MPNPPLQRVLVVGCAGAGKSHFSSVLAARIGLPLVHLDREFWQPGWVEPDKAVWAARVDVLVQAPAWILDGNYGGTLAARLRHADTMILLDTPRRLRLWRVFWRTLRSLGRSRPDMPDNCPERFSLQFLRYIWVYDRDHRPRVIEKLKDFGGRVVMLRTKGETESFLAGVG